MIRSMVTIKKHADEELTDFFSRCNRKVSETFAKLEVEPWSRTCRRIQFDWAAKMILQMQVDSERLTGKVLRYKDLDEIHHFARCGQGWQGHPYRLHVWRWEQNIFNFFAKQSLAWKDLAQDKKEYMKRQDTYLLWRDLPYAQRSAK